MKTPEVFIPLGWNKEEYMRAQERMWGLNARRDALNKIIKQTDSELEAVYVEIRELFSEFPTLSARSREVKG
jgi:hypothetical protein